jgi:hypothetical protein
MIQDSLADGFHSDIISDLCKYILTLIWVDRQIEDGIMTL